MKSLPSSPFGVKVQAVLFDMDGVLISSIESDERSWRRWARLHHMEDTFSIGSTHGRRTIDTIRALRPDLDPSIELQRLEAFDAEDGGGLTVYPGVHELLAALSPSQWSIVTSASEAIMKQRLRILGVPLPLKIVTAEMVTYGKPHPEPYLLAASLLGRAPAECLVIEDSPSGIRAGKDAGCVVLAVESSHPSHVLHEADWVIRSLGCVNLITTEDREIVCCGV
jgi:sugar-phosphatase